MAEGRWVLSNKESCLKQLSIISFCRVGRPKVEINIDDVEFLRSLKFSWERIADIIGVSRSTLMRRIHDEGVVIETFSNISDEQLDHLVSRVKLQHPYDGERLMIGHLAREGVC